jgi:hypothetical protein
MIANLTLVQRLQLHVRQVLAEHHHRSTSEGQLLVVHANVFDFGDCYPLACGRGGML